jgi:hypothetical protein
LYKYLFCIIAEYLLEKLGVRRMILLLALAFCGSVFAETKTVTFKLGAAIGKDACIITGFGCIRKGKTTKFEDMNFGDETEPEAMDWAINTIRCSESLHRALLTFDELSTIPQNTVIGRRHQIE